MPKNVLDIRLTTGLGFVISSLQKPIPQQTLILKSYRVEFAADADALACKLIKFTCPWISSSSCPTMITNETATDYPFYRNGGITFYLDPTAVTTSVNCDLKIDMSSVASMTFDYELFGIDLTNFVEMSFQLEFDQLSS